MEIVDSSGPIEFDTKPFVNYDNEEDRTPTEAELVEELPDYEMPPALKALAEGKPVEKPLRRGVGYLRAEAASDNENLTDTADADNDFGAGLEPDRSEIGTDDPSGQITEATSTTYVADTSTDSKPDEPSGKRKRRRPRRRRGKRKGSSETSQTGGDSRPDSGPVSSSEGSGESGESIDQAPLASAEPSANTEAGAKKSGRGRRRRRRRRGGRGKGDGSSPPTPPAGSSAPNDPAG